MNQTKIRALWHRLAPKPRPLRTERRWTIGLLLLSAVALTALCLLVSTQDFSLARFCSYIRQPVLLLLNILPVALLITVIYCLFNRAWLAFLLPAALLLVLGYINYFKIVLRGEPLTMDDMFLLNEGAGMLGQYRIVPPIWFYLSMGIVLCLTALLHRYARARVPKKRWWLRPTAVLLCVLCGGLAWTQWYTNSALYRKYRDTELFHVGKDAEDYCAHGFVYALLHSVDSTLMRKPEGYSDAEAQRLLSQWKDVPIPEEKRVNVVATMLESYSDLSRLDSIRFTADAYREFHALQEESYCGELISDTCGGGTNNAERAFLTGFTYPQPHYLHDSSSYVRYFSACGYRTDGSHPGKDWFYQRNQVNERLGFDRYLFMENHYAALTKDEHASDELLFEELKNIYDEETADGQPYFSFSVSYQNHSPYESERLLGGEYVSHEGISDAAYYSVNNYLDGIADTGRQLAAYVDSFRERSEPVVLVFFGDHKPSFGSGNCYYEEMGVNAQENTAQGCYNVYATPYLIWANEAAKAILEFAFEGEGPTLSPSFLMTELFNCCGWDGPAWMQMQRQTMRELPVMHRQKMFWADGGLTDELSEAQQELRRKYTVTEYYMRKTLHTYCFG